jgi:hypothetical protein
MATESHWRLVVVGGHTRSIGKTQLVCDLIGAFPEANWIAGKITQYGHGICAQNGRDCDCAPDEHVCALSWETRTDTGTDSGRFLAAGARRSLWLRTKQGFLAEGLPLLRAALRECNDPANPQPGNLILETNTLLQFFKPAFYLMVLDPSKQDFKESARLVIDRASGFVWRQPMDEAVDNEASPLPWSGVSLQLLAPKPQFLQREGAVLPAELRSRVSAILAGPQSILV